MSQHSPIKGFFPGSDLNVVDPSSIATLGCDISSDGPQKSKKLVLITLSKAVQAKNKCSTVASAQRMGRKGTKSAAEAVVDTLAEVARKGTKRKAALDIYSEVDSSNIVPRKRQRRE
jgi:hypothetical protein